jgi:hypothetical protein
MSLCEVYLSQRGITEATSKVYHLEFDDRLRLQIVKGRLGRGLPKGVNEVLWFPIYDSAGNLVSWIARPLPTIFGLPKFLCPVGSGGIPFVPQNVYGLPYGKPVIITEGPVKALACVQAGVDAIGLNGVWGAGVKNSSDQVVIGTELHNALDWRGRLALLGFDADCFTNPQVRQAFFRLFFVLSIAGAQVSVLIWDSAQGKGIADYLVKQGKDGLATLLAPARPFLEILERTPLDLGLISAELKAVFIPELLREQLANPLAQRLGVRVDDIRKIGAAQRKSADFVDPDPWPDPVNGGQLLTDLVALIEKHTITEESCRVAVGLWIILSYLIEEVDTMPILCITSPEKRCGKTRLLTLLLKLVRRPIPGVSLTAATVYRAIEKWHPSLLVDEADGVLRDSRGYDNTELRSVINSGHTRDLAYVPRCVGETHDVTNFSTWCPKAIALIGRMPDSMMDRSIPIVMRRKLKSERVARLRETAPAVFEELQRKIVRFCQDNGTQIAVSAPAFPAGLNDRAEDC